MPLFPQLLGRPPVAFEIKRGDLLPTLIFQVTNDLNQPADLSGASAVYFYMVHTATQKQIGGQATIVDASVGKYLYAWQPGDTDLEGFYIGRVVSVFIAGQMTYPTCPDDGSFAIEICP